MTTGADTTAGLRLALTTLTVLPLPTGRVDRAAGRWAIGWAPLVGVGLGALVAGLLVAAHALGCPPPLAGVLAVGGLALATRGLHLDGLADTADGLGCHAGPDRALAVMRSAEIGPFGVATVVLTVAGQVAALAAVTAAGRWYAAGLAVATGRLALVWACRRGLGPARPDGLGALVAGSQPGWSVAAWTVALAAAGLPAVAGRPWQGPVAVLAGSVVAVGLCGHAARRLAGVTGDVLGAACESAVLAAATVLTLS